MNLNFGKKFDDIGFVFIVIINIFKLMDLIYCGIVYNFHCNACVLGFGQAVAASFCFSNPPKVILNIDSGASKFRRKVRKVEGGRHGFSESSPYGRQGGGDDTRQFVRY